MSRKAKVTLAIPPSPEGHQLFESMLKTTRQRRSDDELRALIGELKGDEE